MPDWFIILAADWGPAFVILAGLAAGVVHYVPRGIFSDFVVAQKEQAVAMISISHSLQAMTTQTSKLDDLKVTLDQLAIDLRVVAQRLGGIEEKVSHARTGNL